MAECRPWSQCFGIFSTQKAAHSTDHLAEGSGGIQPAQPAVCSLTRVARVLHCSHLCAPRALQQHATSYSKQTSNQCPVQRKQGTAVKLIRFTGSHLSNFDCNKRQHSAIAIRSFLKLFCLFRRPHRQYVCTGIKWHIYHWQSCCNADCSDMYSRWDAFWTCLHTGFRTDLLIHSGHCWGFSDVQQDGRRCWLSRQKVQK